MSTHIYTRKSHIPISSTEHSRKMSENDTTIQDLQRTLAEVQLEKGELLKDGTGKYN